VVINFKYFKTKEIILEEEKSFGSDRNLVVSNTIALYFRTIVALFVSLYTSRVILEALGIVDFGIYSIIGGIVVLSSFFNNALSAATQRYLSYALGECNYTNYCKTLSVSIVIHVILSFIVVLIAETAGFFLLNEYINIPVERMDAVNLVFQFSLFSVCVNIVNIPFGAAIISNEKMAIYAYVGIFEALAKLAVAFAITYFPYDKLIFYAFLLFFANVVFLSIRMLYCRYGIGVKIRPNFDLQIIKQVCSFSGWSLFGATANMGNTQGINIILNIFCGVIINAVMGISNQVNGAIYTFISDFQTAFKPRIVKLYAAKRFSEFKSFIYVSSKVSFFMILLISTPVIINTEFVID